MNAGHGLQAAASCCTCRAVDECPSAAGCWPSPVRCPVGTTSVASQLRYKCWTCLHKMAESTHLRAAPCCMHTSDDTNPCWLCLQASYSKDGIFIGGTPTCKVTKGPPGNTTITSQRLSSLYVMSKDALCDPIQITDPDRPDQVEFRLHAAIYFASVSWYRSVSESERGMVPDAYKPFNSHINPARPQHVSDLDDAPLFVMKVWHMVCCSRFVNTGHNFQH